MDSFIDIDRLKENSTKYQTIISKQKFTSNVLSFFEVVKAELSELVQSLIITNREKPNRSKALYTLKISRDSVELLELNSQGQNHIILLFDPPSLSLNDKEMGAAYSRAFGMRIREIISDIKNDRCFVFEEQY